MWFCCETELDDVVERVLEVLNRESLKANEVVSTERERESGLGGRSGGGGSCCCIYYIPKTLRKF